MKTDLGKSWNKLLKPEMKKGYFVDLARAIDVSYKKTTVFPAKADIFAAFTHCPFEDVAVVILGQDPYHGAGQAHGLSFSVPDDTKIPPSLRNIYKELASDVGVSMAESGNLTHWSRQGVLLLNSTLTVEEGLAGYHQGWGWETFTDEVIQTISDKKEHVVFLLWGKFAQDKAKLVDTTKHLILTAPHPSPLSSHRGFFGCRHFSQTNQDLKQHNLPEIQW
jgi:uracil-DNA glycosylase